MVNAALLLSTSRVQLARLPVLLDALLTDLDLADWRARPIPREWAPIEIVCHLRDEEVEDFGARLRVVLDSGARFTSIDPERWVEDRRYRDADPGEALAALRERRMATLAFLATVPPDRLSSGLDHPKLGRLSGLDLLAAWVAHDRLHLAQLANTLARLWATRWAPARVDYAGPIPYGAPDERSLTAS
jgi:hypothetical protein